MRADIVDGVPAETKAERRDVLLAARRALGDDVRHAEAQALCEHLGDVVSAHDTVCAYTPVGAEPGSAAMLDRLREVCARVLLPVTRTGADGEPLPLLWGEYVPGTLVAGRFGLLEPAEPWLPGSVLSEAAVVLVPALAVDRSGVRLGRGGGYYDRSLAQCTPGTRLVAVVRDTEFVDELPREAHDIRMTHALTPGGGLIALRDVS